MLMALYKDKLIVNIDESWFDRSARTEYIWLPIAKSSPILNSSWTGSATWIFGLFSDGRWVSILKNGTTKAMDFWLFLLILKQYLRVSNIWPVREVILTLENASIHVSTLSKRWASFFELEMNLLPPYCLHLAPVEMVFAIVKKAINLRYSGIRKNFSFSDGKNAIVEVMKKKDLEVGLRLWKRFIKEAKSWIWEANIEIKLWIYKLSKKWRKIKGIIDLR